MRFLLSFLVLFIGSYVHAQSFEDSIQTYQEDYLDKHEVVTPENKKDLHFFAPDKKYRVLARVELKANTPWIPFATSGKMKKNYRVYAVLHFTINDTAVQLSLFQSQDLLNSDEYREYLFLPFTDATSGNETYEGGRYLDLKFEDLKNNQMLVDFNKAYNPYCAYVANVYSCPIPPAENHLSVAIRAGEKKYTAH